MNIVDSSVMQPYASNTTITNNTNIVLVGGRSYMINTSGRSPPEVIEINADKSYQMRSSVKTAGKPAAEYTVSHTKTNGDFFEENSRKASRALANNAKQHEIHQSKSQAPESKAMALRTQNNQGGTSLAVSKNKRKISGITTPIKNSGVIHTRKASTSVNPSKAKEAKYAVPAKINPKTEEDTKENSIENILVNKQLQIEEETKIIIKSSLELAEVKKMDPRREKEMHETAEYVKKCTFNLIKCANRLA